MIKREQPDVEYNPFRFRKIKNISYISDCLLYFTKYIKSIHKTILYSKKRFSVSKQNFSLKIFYFTFNMKALCKI